MTRVLLVDDNAQLRTLVTLFLESWDWEVLAASDAAGATEIAARGGVDLLVTDVSLGGATGLSLAGRVRLRNPHVRVLYVSGHDPAELDRMAAGEGLPPPLHGQDGFLRKPFGLAEFRDTVNALLAQTSFSSFSS